jgi:hypothetical protein
VVDGDGEVLVGDALGTWRFRPQGSGAIGIDPPAGFGLPLRVGIVEAPRRVPTGGSAFFTIALSKPARIRTVTRGGGETHTIPLLDVGRAGRTKIAWSAPTEPGRYEVTLAGRAGAAHRKSEPVEVVVYEEPLPTHPEAARGPQGAAEETPPYGLLGLIGAVLVASFIVVRAVLRVRGRSEDPGKMPE